MSCTPPSPRPPRRSRANPPPASTASRKLNERRERSPAISAHSETQNERRARPPPPVAAGFSRADFLHPAAPKQNHHKTKKARKLELPSLRAKNPKLFLSTRLSRKRWPA